jgi:hypothetical protein
LQPLDLADPWIGPQTYAEDFYSGGDIHEGVLDPALVSPSNLTPARALSEHTWEQDANGLLPLSPEMVHKETIIMDVDMDEDEKDEDLLPTSSLLALPVEDHDPRQHEYDSREEESGAREGEYDENYVFRDDESLDEFLGDKVGDERPREAGMSRFICFFCVNLIPLQIHRLLSPKFPSLLNHKLHNWMLHHSAQPSHTIYLLLHLSKIPTDRSNGFFHLQLPPALFTLVQDTLSHLPLTVCLR